MTVNLQTNTWTKSNMKRVMNKQETIDKTPIGEEFSDYWKERRAVQHYQYSAEIEKTTYYRISKWPHVLQFNPYKVLIVKNEL